MNTKFFLRSIFLIGFVTAMTLFLFLAPSHPAQAQTTWNLVWSDEFNGAANTGVDPNNWKYDTGQGIFGTGEIETMTNSTANVYQDGQGHLVIKAIGSGNNWTSGRIETQRSDFQPPAGGKIRIESSLQQPNLSGAAAAGYWPAFWMLGSTLRTGGVWPDVGEWDILEDINGRSSVFGTLHCGVSPGGPCNENTGIGSGERACAGCQTGFHTYAIEYDTSVSPEQLRWYLDGVNYFTINATQLDATTWAHATHRANFIIYDLAMGGGFPAGFGGGPTASTVSGGTIVADYVRVYYSSTTTTPDGTPYTGSPVSIPGKVEAENFNNGGEGVAYHDSDAVNNGGQYRTADGVDIENSSDTGGGYDIGWSVAGEWMKYTVNVASTGNYNFDFRVASNVTGGQFHMEVDNTNVTGSLTGPNTGGWQTWTDVFANNISLTAGQHVFKWVTDVGGANYNWFSVTAANTPPTSTSAPTNTPISGPAFPWINAGGGASGGYSADAFFDSGNMFADASTAIDTSKNLDSNPAPQAVYQDVRWNPNFTYTIPGLTAGANYTVTLHWAELTWQAAGSRKFNVAINGATVLSGFDVFAAAGFKEAISRSFTTTANGSGQIVIAFTNGGADNPFISGIQIFGTSGGGPTNTPMPTNTPVPNTPVPTNTPTFVPPTATFTNTPIPSGNGNPYNGTPYAVPGKVEVENYNTGGEGVAYHDSDAINNGGQYRPNEGVDIETTSDTGGGFDMGWTATGEWEKITVNVQSTGTYNIDFRVASNATGGAFHLEVDGNNVTGTLSVPNTGGWQTWTTVTKTGVSLSAGQHVLRLYQDAGGGNFNWINFTLVIPPTATSSADGSPYNGTPAAVPGKVEAENYNTGGEGVAYHDAETLNQGGQYRPNEGVDIETTSDAGGGYNVGWTATGEWMKYTVNVTASGTYNIDFRVASANTGSTFHLEVDGANVTGTMTVPNTGGWQTWTTITKAGVNFTTGQHVLRWFIDNGGMNFNWFNIGTGSSSPSKVFAPYIDVSPGSGSSIMQLASNGSGNKHYTLAFIIGSGCNATWFGAFAMNTAEANGIGTDINNLRAAGGDVIVSFGGAAAPELANVCPDAGSLQAQYQSVVSKYNLTTVDYDIEDFNPTAIDIRNKAIKGLEAANPNLKVHYTLGVLSSGLTQAQLDVLNNANANGTRVDLVNIMAMDYGQNITDMGGAAISAAQNTRNQLNGMGLGSTQLGITPMIGQNDSNEIFTLANASSLASWANSNGVALIGFWSMGRDNGGCPGNTTASPSCSGVAQSNWQFSSIFHGFAN